jgi:outer membrane protein
MIKNIKKLIFTTIIFLTYSFTSFADNSHFIDFTKVLNKSKPGAGAQKTLKDRFESESKKFKKIEENIKKEESEIISQKKILSPEEYKKKVESLRKKVADLQKKKQVSFNNIAKSRNSAKEALLKAVNPIVKKYMEDNKIRIVLNKQSVILGDSTLEITDEIIAILNKEFPSLTIN